MVSSFDEPPSKRLKQDDQDDLEALLFENEDEAARQRRLKRRQRWNSHKQEESGGNGGVVAQQQQQESIAQEPITQHVVVEETTTTFMESKDEASPEPPQDDDDDDSFDMFSSSVSPPKMDTQTTATTTITTATPKTTHDDDCDDEEGYYKAVLGETITCGPGASYKVLGIVGKGVFSTVLKAKLVLVGENESDQQVEVALKLIRNNETMRKASQTEISILKSLKPHPHVVQLLNSQSPPQEHLHHVVLCFEYQRYNLRDILQKFGRGVGISLQSVSLYFLQLLSALHHLKRHGVIHADLKPDNILVSEDFGKLQVCDFGSAFLQDSQNIPTPYLVSRYYRAPEIILGLIPSYEVDLWSAAVTVAELFIGRVLFAGSSNNDMLQSMMQALGPFPQKQIKQHALACRTHPTLPLYFQEHYFLQWHVDKVTGVQLSKQVSLQNFPTTTLQSILLKSKSKSDSRIKVLQFADLLRKCCALDPSKRMDLQQAMHHEFFQTKKAREEVL